MSAAALRRASGETKLWGLAAGAALSLHVVAAAALLTFSPEPDGDDTGAPAIEISLAPAAPRVLDAPDAPPGPLANEAAAAASSAASAAKTAEDHEKIAQAEDEDAEFARSEKTDKPIEDATSALPSQAIASMESSASEATAPPRSEAALDAPRPAAPTPGADKAAQAAKLTWQKALMAHLNRNKRYPAGAKQRSAEVGVGFTLDRRGHVVEAWVKRSAGQTEFDEAALAMMKRADPVPAPPPAVADDGLSFEVPVAFRPARR